VRRRPKLCARSVDDSLSNLKLLRLCSTRWHSTVLNSLTVLAVTANSAGEPSVPLIAAWAGVPIEQGDTMILTLEEPTLLAKGAK